MKKLIIILLFFITTSCFDESYEMRYIVTNNSEHSIKFDFFSNYHTIPSVTIFENESIIYDDDSKGSFNEGYFPYNEFDSIRITYNNNISVVHNSTLYTVQRNILQKSKFLATQNESNYREFQYSFVENDYQEAIILNQ